MMHRHEHYFSRGRVMRSYKKLNRSSLLGGRQAGRQEERRFTGRSIFLAAIAVGAVATRASHLFCTRAGFVMSRAGSDDISRIKTIPNDA